jgi:hypothetical protein
MHQHPNLAIALCWTRASEVRDDAARARFVRTMPCARDHTAIANGVDAYSRAGSRALTIERLPRIGRSPRSTRA